MNVALAYVFPQVQIQKYRPLAKRFATTYEQFASTEPHTLHVIANGAPLDDYGFSLFNRVPARFHTYSNLGWDIGAFQWFADHIPCDLLVCLGACVHFHRPGWLEAMVGAYLDHGPALYGCWAYLAPNWHVRTTVFWCPPQLLSAYPNSVGSSRTSRYEFEHGNTSFTRFALSAGMETWMVTRRGCFPFSQWADHAPGVPDSLCLDQHIHE